MAGWRNLVAATVLVAGVALAAPSASAQAFDTSNEEQDAYVQGNLLFLAYHEVGHLVLDSLLEIDQRDDRLSAEETADDIATWLMLPDPDEPDQDVEILAAMLGWLDSADEQDEVEANPHYPDDAERAARIACYLYGSNPSRYRVLARAFRNSIASVNCEEEHAALHADLEDWFHEYLVPPALPDGGRIQVSYQASPPALDAARRYLIDTGVLEHVADDINEFIRLPSNVTLTARSCGGGAAEFRYNAANREIIAC
jgi:Putative metallopeptidase